FRPSLKGASVVGVFWGSFAQRQSQDNAANFTQLFAWFEEGKLKPLVSTVYPLERAGEAIDLLGGAGLWGRWWFWLINTRNTV
ncbi:Oxidoreductase, zinc-binding protein, partial [Pseudomonas syringae pv. maculicola]